MPRCLFCLREGQADALQFTEEHVFPAALGGNLVVTDGSCDGCNHGNSRFEQPLALELRPIRMLLQIPDRYGNLPHAAATIVTPEVTYSGHVKADGSVFLNPHKTEEKNDKGESEVVYRFLPDMQKEKLRQRAKERGQELIEMIGPGDPVTAEVHVGGDLMVIGSQAGLRTVAKIAYVGLAYLTGTVSPRAKHSARYVNLSWKASPKALRGFSSITATLKRASMARISIRSRLPLAGMSIGWMPSSACLEA